MPIKVTGARQQLIDFDIVAEVNDAVGDSLRKLGVLLGELLTEFAEHLGLEFAAFDPVEGTRNLKAYFIWIALAMCSSSWVTTGTALAWHCTESTGPCVATDIAGAPRARITIWGNSVNRCCLSFDRTA